uniref:NTF2 domain-containing protein n=1 Tax=Pseudo-nitzschia australis TaxID=44445 RepID=A0A7S4AF14_9STRA|eukprot:CAMPEP_0168164950 /NCGR_PEP_ID=MMETSP0139_2-20121125/1219_1 /TAXON_ID=44445 /ORGANISM="Pseudo-nitzschia australis, Strain 10249 10 AB" /LENGTH=568 /DNA_ID=CAMNT_0008082019 /DNA_START=40 /DNA_END=1746 /DNA_ORIENTATION=-
MNTSNSNSSFTLEDRHSLSDPRPIPNLKLPTWEVDVYREGVDVPIMTLRVDSTVLPPRKNKKKKIQWKLPDSIKTLPKFGEQERRRVLELFREKKKELKKLKNKQRAYRRASSMESMNDDSNSNSGEGTTEYINCNGSGGGDDNVNGNGNGVNNDSTLDAAKKMHVVEGLPPEINGKAQQQSKQQRKQKQKQHKPIAIDSKNKQGSDNVDVIIVPGDDSVLASSLKKIEGGDGGDCSPSPPGFGHSSKASLPPPPPGIPSSSTLKPAPPGLPSKNNLYSSSSSSTNDWNATGYKNGYSSSTSSSSPSPTMTGNLQSTLPAQNGQHQHQRQHQHHNIPQNSMKNSFAPPAPGIMNGHNHPHRHSNGSIKAQTPIAPPMAIGPCFVLPPNAPQGSTIGKFVTETYYLSLRNGLIRELDAYYYHSGGSNSNNNSTNSTDVARVCKAVTVGGAHAFCTSQQDRLMQLNTFAGTEMRIKGVQEQPTVGNGILVLITGVSIRNNNNNGSPRSQQQQLQPPQQLPFCHTLILTPVLTVTAPAAASVDSTAPMNSIDSTIGYQILNDNLVILTVDE